VLGFSFLCAPYMALLALRDSKSSASENGQGDRGSGQMPLLPERSAA